MKKKLITFLVTLSIGVIISFFFYYKMDKSNALLITNNKVYLYQLGVYESIDNANNFVSTNNIGSIYYDGTFYRIYFGMTINNSSLYEAFLESKNLAYYQKEIKVNAKVYELIKEYDALSKNYDDLIINNKALMEYYYEYQK